MDLKPERLLFIDETSTATNMTRSHGRCRKGERLRMGFPHGHRKTTRLVAGLRMSVMVAPMVLDGPINGDWFEAYVTHVLVPVLQPDDVVIMDNLSSHKRASDRKAFSKLKAMLRKAEERTVSGLWGLIGKCSRCLVQHTGEIQSQMETLLQQAAVSRAYPAFLP